MTDEQAFLAAVADRPGDPTPRLVYADWLDDRGDRRAELVRIEEEMRRLPADADRYWALKPRRNELRAACSADWLAALGYGTVYRPVLAPWPGADVRGRFRLLRELVERWYGVPLPDAGGRAEEVAGVEARLGRLLPEAVSEWIAFALDVQERPPANRILRDGFGPDTVEHHADLGVVAVLEQAEGDVLWAVPADRLADTDPPVRVHYLDYDGNEEYDTVGDPSGTTTEFAFAYVLGYLGGGPGHLIDAPRAAGLAAAAGQVFPHRVTIGRPEVFEAEGALATYGSIWDANLGRRQLSVWNHGPIPDPAVAGWVEGLRG